MASASHLQIFLDTKWMFIIIEFVFPDLYEESAVVRHKICEKYNIGAFSSVSLELWI